MSLLEVNLTSSKMIFNFVALLCFIGHVHSNVWLTSFLPPKSRPQHNNLKMSTTILDGKAKKLSQIKDKCLGRSDLTSMKDEDGDEMASYASFMDADNEEIDPPTPGRVVTGTIIEMDESGALLEMGGKMSGYLPLKEASLVPIKNVNELYQIGMEITAEVIGTLKGMPVISMRPTQLAQAWEKILNVRATDATFEVTVEEVNRGGAVCTCFGLKAFLPGSHSLGLISEALIGKTLQVKFLDVIEEEGKLVISQKRAINTAAAAQMVRGTVVNATVTGLREYGAFVEVDGGSSGLLHISQISYDRVDNLEALFTTGQRVKVMVLDYDRLNGRAALSTKTLEPNPGDMLRNMENVFANAEATAAKYHQRMEAERAAREAAAKDIVAGLGGALDATLKEGSDPLLSVAESIESILASIVSESPAAPPS